MKKVKDILFPPRCLSCKEITDTQGSLCQSCWSNIRFIEKPFCSICGFPMEYDMGEDILCGACIKKTPPYDSARSVFIYDEHSKNLITGFKYGDKTHGAEPFAKWIVKASMEFENTIVVPVPLHRIRLFTRRYNQAALLANEIGKITGEKVIPDLLIRKKHNAPQASLPQKQRYHNVKNIFSANPKYKITGKNITLIDDVMTTGATVNECTKVLKKAGALKVNVLTLAKTLRS